MRSRLGGCRASNEEADALTNGRLGGFDEKPRVQVDLEQLGFKLRPRLLESGVDFMERREALRRVAQAAGAARRRSRGDGLRERQPL